MSENAHLRQIRRLVNIIDDRVHHAYYSGDVDSKWANTDDIIDHAEAMARDLAEAEATASFERGRREAAYVIRDEYKEVNTFLNKQLAEAEARVAILSRYIVYAQPCQHHGSAVSRAGMRNDDPVFSGDLPVEGSEA